MRVTVLGAGAVGGWLAAGLARAGHEVGILARGASLAALQAQGLVFLEGERREIFRLPVTNDPAVLRGADLLLLGLKSHDLPHALPLIEALLGERTLILPAQNGIPWWFLQGFGGPAEGLTLESVDSGGALARTLPADRVIGCVAHVASRADAPGQIRLVKADRLLLGDPGGALGSRIAALVETFHSGGVPAEAVPDIRAEIWLKLWGNSNMNPLSALCRADAAQMLDDAGIRGLVVAMMREMAEIGARIGLPITQDPEQRIAVTRRLGAFRTSMLQDLEAGRTLEIGPLLGGLVELADHLDLDAPQLRGVHGLVRLLARNLGLDGAAPAG